MRALLATNHLFGWTGSELQLSLINSVLKDSDFSTVIYSDFSSGNDFCKRLFGDTLCVSLLQELVAWNPDIAYVQHHSIAVQIRSIFPNLPILHAQLGVLPHLEKAPRVDIAPSARLAISEEVENASRIEFEQLNFEQLDLIVFRNIVDDNHFYAVEEIDDLKSLVLYSYKLDSARIRAIGEASERLGFSISASMHASGNFPYAEVPDVLHKGEIVVASGRGAIEAMLCGKVPLIMANCGDDGLVTPDNFRDLMKVNFSGRFTSRKFTTEDVVVEIQKYRKQYGPELRELARSHFGKTFRAQSVVDVFTQYASFRPRAFSQDELLDIRFAAQTYSLQREFSRSEAWFRAQASENIHNAEMSIRDQRIRDMENTISELRTEIRKIDAQIALLTDLFGEGRGGVGGRQAPERL
jgi:hypothetical protein